MISSTIFRLIDGLLLCANKLCGIDPVNFEGEETDFLSFLLFSDEVGFAFSVSAILATILLVIFTVFMIIRSITKDKVEGTPTQIAIKAFKTILMFFFIPAIMIAFMGLGNAFVNALYGATVQSAATPGAFLFSAFAADGGMAPEYVELFRTGDLDYTSTSEVAARMNISDFPFLFSWLAGGVVLFGIGGSMLIFVDRVISLVILYIVAPGSISTSVLDDGARFKLWRDQFLAKFIMGYGMIIAINIYGMICTIVMKPGFEFFSGTDGVTGFLDLLMKLLIIAGGALTMQKSMALIGNLVSSGAGSNELRDNALSMGSLGRMAKNLAGKALYVPSLPFRAGKSIIGDAIAMQSRHLGSRMLRGLHLGGGNDTKKDKDGVEDPGQGGSGSGNNSKAQYGSNGNLKQAIENPGFKTAFAKSNMSNDKSNQKKNGALSKAIQGNGKTNTSTQANKKK